MPKYMSRILIIYLWPLVLAYAFTHGLVMSLALFWQYCVAAWNGEL